MKKSKIESYTYNLISHFCTITFQYVLISSKIAPKTCSFFFAPPHFYLIKMDANKVIWLEIHSIHCFQFSFTSAWKLTNLQSAHSHIRDMLIEHEYIPLPFYFISAVSTQSLFHALHTYFPFSNQTHFYYWSNCHFKNDQLVTALSFHTRKNINKLTIN